jgi:glycosyltransferase involved in cell wall biosynthesis
MTHISVVIPVLNEEKLIAELVNRVTKNVEVIESEYEVIIIDDGSSDQTWESIQQHCNKNPRVKGIKLSKNFGHHYAITAGLDHSQGEWVVVMDGDLQDRPEVISDLYKKAKEGFDVVFVSRSNRPETFIYKSLQKYFYFLLRTLSGIDFDSRQANFSIINRKVVEAFKKFPENARFYGSTIKWLGFNRTYIEASHGERFSGKPSYTLKKRINLALDIILSFSDRPLKFAIGIGTFMSILSFSLILWILLGVFNWGFTQVGWPSLMAVILLIGGVVLIVLGIIGTYIGRIFREVRNRPLYVIDEKVNY